MPPSEGGDGGSSPPGSTAIPATPRNTWARSGIAHARPSVAGFRTAATVQRCCPRAGPNDSKPSNAVVRTTATTQRCCWRWAAPTATARRCGSTPTLAATHGRRCCQTSRAGARRRPDQADAWHDAAQRAMNHNGARLAGGWRRPAKPSAGGFDSLARLDSMASPRALPAVASRPRTPAMLGSRPWLPKRRPDL